MPSALDQDYGAAQRAVIGVLLAEGQGRSLSASEVAAVLGCPEPRAVRALRRLQRKRIVRWAGQGRYCLVQGPS